MQRLLRASARARPWIAMVASYALALQMMLAGIATVRVAAADAPLARGGFVLCSASRDEPQKPPTHDTGCAACASCMMCAGPPAVVAAPAESHFAANARVARVAPVAAALIVTSRHTPRQSRGPPASA